MLQENEKIIRLPAENTTLKESSVCLAYGVQTVWSRGKFLLAGLS